MHLFHHRPMALAATLAALSAVFFFHHPGGVALVCFWCAAMLGLLFLILFFRRRSLRALMALLCMLALSLTAISSYSFFHVRYAAVQGAVGERHTVVGTVLSRDSSLSYATRLTVAVTEWDGEPTDMTLQLACAYASALRPGERLEASGILEDRSEEDAYDAELNRLADGIFGILTVEEGDCKRLSEDERSLRTLMSEWRENASYRLSSAIGGEEGKLASALLLGNREELGARETLAFRRTGVAHLLALSGLHVSLLIGFVDRLLFCLRLPKRIRGIVVSGCAVGYLLLTGASPSIVRSVLMLLSLYLSFYLRGSHDSFTTLTVILAGLLILTPYAVADIGTWMSFLAAGSIVIFLPAFEERLERWREKSCLPIPLQRALSGALCGVLVGVIANLGLMLLQASAFRELSLLSVPATLVLSLPTAAILATAPLVLAFPALAPLTRLPAAAMLSLVRALGDIPNVLVSMQNECVRCGLILLSAVLICLAVFKLRRLLWGLLPIGLALVTIFYAVWWGEVGNDETYVDYLHGGSGEVLLVTRGAHGFAVDFAEGGASEAYALAKTASERGCTELELLIVTHYHNMTTHFLHALSSWIEVQTVWLPPTENEEERLIALRIREEAKRCGMEIAEELNPTPIEGVTLLEATHAHYRSGRHPALLFALSTDSHTLTYCNASVAGSVLYDRAAALLSVSDYVIVGSTGTEDAGAYLPPLSDALRCLSLADEAQIRLFFRPPPSECIRAAEARLAFSMRAP